MSGLPIKVMTQAELSQWREGVRGADAQAAKLAECGYVPLAFLNDGWFTWLCPGCGYFSRGRVGECVCHGSGTAHMRPCNVPGGCGHLHREGR